jgi:hypothetical protein
MAILCEHLMNQILNYVPTDWPLLNNIRLCCKSFKLQIEPRINSLFWEPLEEWLGIEICDGLRRNTLKKLILQTYGCQTRKTERDLFYLLKRNTSLEEISFTEEYVCMDSIIHHLQNNTSLKILSLCVISVDYEDVNLTHLLKAVKKNNTLTELCLACNDDLHEYLLGDYIYDLLNGTTSLKKLDLSVTKQTSVDVMKISMGLINNNTLTHLSLRHCLARNDGAWAIANLLKHNSTLKKIDLYDNRILDQGMKSLYYGLVKNNSLEEIILGQEDYQHFIKEDTIELLDELVDQKEHLIISHGFD